MNGFGSIGLFYKMILCKYVCMYVCVCVCFNIVVLLLFYYNIRSFFYTSY